MNETIPLFERVNFNDLRAGDWYCFEAENFMNAHKRLESLGESNIYSQQVAKIIDKDFIALLELRQ